MKTGYGALQPTDFWVFRNAIRGERRLSFGIMCKKNVSNGYKITFEPAHVDDTESINMLINQAYRGKKGWTRETEIVEGDRSSANDVKALIQSPKAHLFVAEINEVIVACICVEEKQNQAYIGTFAVNPVFQNQGIGKQVLGFAEKYAAEQLGSKKLIMLVISQREELISFYERRGYKRTGKKSEYPVHLNVGIPVVEDLTIECLEKNA